ncbi:hypothetical protein XENOCAPTIV_015026 [Xenoophorus captivus]|uniref:Uncharacterized protein n=1 Tax=Xenoophorus captivus TaxID=1517983 RepID=A0ABV0R933_9TELE
MLRVLCPYILMRSRVEGKSPLERATQPAGCIQDIRYNYHILRVMPLLNKRHQRRLTWANEEQVWAVAQCFQVKVHFGFHFYIKIPESKGSVERHRLQAA